MDIVEDISWQSKADIGVVLSRPQLTGRRGIQMKFNPHEIAKCKRELHKK